MCGIWAIINQEEAPFDYQSFCTLGCANDSRGGDSCGIFIDGAVEYGIGKKELFESFFWTSELLNTVETAKIALGHDRKASVGGVTLEKAHPIVIYEPTIVEGEEKPREEVKFVLIHNGTIYNYEELAKKYIPNINIKDMSDSQVLARLLYYSGFDFLSEYNGGAAFIAVDYRKEEPEIIIWRGESKKSSISNEIEEERPLYCNLDNGRLVLSSISSYLQIVDGNCYVVPGNQVLTYKNNTLYIVKKIDRSQAQQTKKTVTNYDYGDYYYRGYNSVRYITCNRDTNTYKIGEDNLDGFVRITSYGRLIGKYDSYTATEHQHAIWFFNGIALIDKKAYMFLNKAKKRTKLNIEEFTKNYQNLIRFFSYDKLYFDNDSLYKASGPFRRELYTGYYQLLSNASCDRYVLGVKQMDSKITDIFSSFLPFEKVQQFDYKTIWKEFIQSMG